MTSNGVHLEPAFVIHKRPFRNTSLILDLLTRCYGRVSVVAKGVKRGKSPMSRICQPFIPLLVSWQGRSDLKTVVGLEVDRARSALTLNGMSLISGLYLNELLLRLCPAGDAYEALYESYEQTLVSLNQHQECIGSVETGSVETDFRTPTDRHEQVQLNDELKRLQEKYSPALEILLRRFELQLLAELGFGLDLQFEGLTHQPIQEKLYYQYQSGVGFVSCQRDVTQKEAATLGEKLIASGAILQAMAQGDFSSAETCRYAKKLMRSILHAHLGGQSLQVRSLLPPVMSP